MFFRTALLLLVMMVLYSTAHAKYYAEPDSMTTHLKGLKGVHVVAEDLQPVLTKAGIQKDAMVTKVNARLRSLEVPLYSDYEASDSPFIPMLFININSVSGNNGNIAFAVTVTVLEPSISLRDGESVLKAQTWISGLIKVTDDHTEVCKTVLDVVDQFAYEYLIANLEPTDSLTSKDKAILNFVMADAAKESRK